MKVNCVSVISAIVIHGVFTLVAWAQVNPKVQFIWLVWIQQVCRALAQFTIRARVSFGHGPCVTWHGTDEAWKQ